MYGLSASLQTACFCSADNAAKISVWFSWATYSKSTLCYQVTLIADPTSTFVLNFSYHWGLDIVSCQNE
jgi:hypothetical protein